MKTVGYVRVSTTDQSTQLQVDALDTWASVHKVKLKVYSDHFTGRTMARPGWNGLWSELQAGNVSRIVVWKLDRLGRTASELLQLFTYLLDNHISLVSITEGFDLTTPNGRLMAKMLAAFAEFEREMRSERQKAGIEARRDAVTGKLPWSEKGKPLGWTKGNWRRAAELRAKGFMYKEIASAMGISATTVRAYLGRAAQDQARS